MSQVSSHLIRDAWTEVRLGDDPPTEAVNANTFRDASSRLLQVPTGATAPSCIDHSRLTDPPVAYRGDSDEEAWVDLAEEETPTVPAVPAAEELPQPSATDLEPAPPAQEDPAPSASVSACVPPQPLGEPAMSVLVDTSALPASGPAETSSMCGCLGGRYGYHRQGCTLCTCLGGSVGIHRTECPLAPN